MVGLLWLVFWTLPNSAGAAGEKAAEAHYRGIHIVSLPPRGTVPADIGLVDHRRALSKIRGALDLIYQMSPLNGQALERLKQGGDVIVVHDPDFPWAAFNRVTLAGFLPRVPATLRSEFPDIFQQYSYGRGKKTFFAVLGRYVIKHPLAELAGGGIVHELVGHGVQHLRGRLTGRRQLDVECEASLYEFSAYQDLKIDKFSRDMVMFRKELELRNCSDFKRYMRREKPASMALWDALRVDVPAILAVFEGYATSLAR